ncbi:regulatory protein RecX [Aeromicrobium sp. CF3.5]|uniref:regulatory protein RecX n=1 Tax=Aeromicrobium sp. CF3.5 TaxID=3373078 RepID=UPI003EE5DDC6
MAWAQRQHEEITDPVEALAVAKQVVYGRLAAQARSRADLEQALASKGVPAQIVSDVLDRCEASGLVDDVEFARAWVQQRQANKGLSSRALAQELRGKGVDDQVARDVLAELDPDVEVQAAHDLVQRKLRSMSQLDEATRTRRLVGMLARKGYSPGLAFQVVREELGAEAPVIESL